MARMLNKAHTKNGLAGPAGRRRRCTCGECEMTKTKTAARQAEKREWLAEAVSSGATG